MANRFGGWGGEGRHIYKKSGEIMVHRNPISGLLN